MSKPRILLVVLMVVLLPLGAHYLYHLITDFPPSISIATGPPEGRYQSFGESLAREIKARLGVEVKLVSTSGSFENLRLLRQRRVDFALYQSGSPAEDTCVGEPVASVQAVAALYPEVVHYLVARDLELTDLSDLAGKRVGVGPTDSGNRATSLSMLHHFGLTLDDVEARPLDYQQMEAAFRDDELDAAFLTAGIGAPILQKIVGEDACRILPVPFAEALARRSASMTTYTIPAGIYRSERWFAPSSSVETVALRSQLLTRDDVQAGLVEEVTHILLAEDFQRSSELVELFEHGSEFARTSLDFPIHSGADRVYDPDLHPFVNPDFVEATEGTRSFVVSLLIAAYLAFRWVKARRERGQEHQLDGYMQKLLEIERRQMELDQELGSDDIEMLQVLLDDVTVLRQQALSDFTAHDMNEDRAVECFVHMCHSLSDKINAKMTRQRLERQIDRLVENNKS